MPGHNTKLQSPSISNPDSIMQPITYFHPTIPLCPFVNQSHFTIYESICLMIKALHHAWHNADMQQQLKTKNCHPIAQHLYGRMLLISLRHACAENGNGAQASINSMRASSNCLALHMPPSCKPQKSHSVPSDAPLRSLSLYVQRLETRHWSQPWRPAAWVCIWSTMLLNKLPCPSKHNPQYVLFSRWLLHLLLAQL